MTLNDARASGARARRQIAPSPPATLGDSARSAFEDIVANDLSVSANLLLRDEYARYLDRIQATTGQRLDNPLDFPDSPADFEVPEPNPVMERLREANPMLGFGAAPMARPKTMATREREVFDAVDKLRNDFPDLPIRSPAQLRENVKNRRGLARSLRADVARREGAGGTVLAFGVGAATFLADPPVLASLAFGAPAATGILRAAAIDAGIGAATEIPVQALVQSARVRLGETPSLSEAAANVLTAGAGGFLFSAALRAAGKALGKAFKGRAPSREEVDAARYLERKLDLEAATPFDRDAPAARAEHELRVSEAEMAVREGRAPKDRVPVAAVRRDAIEPTATAIRDVSAFDDGAPAAGFAAVLKDLGAAVRTDGPETARRAARRVVGKTRVEVRDPATLKAFVKDLFNPPRPAGERLSSFLAKLGGVRDEGGALKAAGLPKARPGLLRKNGLPLDAAGEKAAEAGFFTERPTAGELTDAISDDVNGRPVLRPEQAAADDFARATAESADAAIQDFAEVGIDLANLTPDQVVGRIRALDRRLSETAEGGPGVAAPEPQATVGEAQLAARTLADLERESTEITAALEADVRDTFKGRLDAIVSIEDDAENIVRQRVGDVFDDIDAEETLAREFAACIGGPLT